MCRATGPITADHACQPFSIFNIINYDRSQGDTVQAAGTIFNTIAKQVLKHGKQSSLDQETVLECLGLCDKDTKIKKSLQGLLDLFGGKDKIPILGNHKLSMELIPLAQHLAGNLVSANKTAQAFVRRAFEQK